VIFGGDGLFLAVMQGPGRVWLQTLPISRLAHKIYEYIPHGESARQTTAAGVGGGLLGAIAGQILNGDK
jgi:uncharacterized protein (AIM24 family)